MSDYDEEFEEVTEDDGEEYDEIEILSESGYPAPPSPQPPNNDPDGAYREEYYSTDGDRDFLDDGIDTKSEEEPSLSLRSGSQSTSYRSGESGSVTRNDTMKGGGLSFRSDRTPTSRRSDMEGPDGGSEFENQTSVRSESTASSHETPSYASGVENEASLSSHHSSFRSQTSASTSRTPTSFSQQTDSENDTNNNSEAQPANLLSPSTSSRRSVSTSSIRSYTNTNHSNRSASTASTGRSRTDKNHSQRSVTSRSRMNSIREDETQESSRQGEATSLDKSMSSRTPLQIPDPSARIPSNSLKAVSPQSYTAKLEGMNKEFDDESSRSRTSPSQDVSARSGLSNKSGNMSNRTSESRRSNVDINESFSSRTGSRSRRTSNSLQSGTATSRPTSARSINQDASDRTGSIRYSSNSEEMGSFSNRSETSRQEDKSFHASSSSRKSDSGATGRSEREGAPNSTNGQYSQYDTKDKAHSLAILGTMSNTGKSVIAAAICRILVNSGIRVAPFKAQNISNNASPALLPDPKRSEDLYKSLETATQLKLTTTTPATKEGYGEIGTAQSLQAEACKIVPRVEMNPVLMKPGGQDAKGEDLYSVVVLGKQIIRETFGDFKKRTSSLRSMILESHGTLSKATEAEIVVIEGAGSCTELNLMDRDIANLPLVRSLNCPWLLVANFDCGGVFAQVVGTRMCVPQRDWDLCVGVIVNKLRREAEHFEPGPKMLERMVGKPIFVVPFFDGLSLPTEDDMGIDCRLAWEKDILQKNDTKDDKPVVVVVAYPHIAFADDLFPLEQDDRFHVEWRRQRIPKPYPSTTSVILPGSRLTMTDLKWLIDSGWADFVRKHRAAGGTVIGFCGGYQMLGRTLMEPEAIEGKANSKQGIGLLPITTTIAPAKCKVVQPRKGQLYPSGIQVEGFEVHCGVSEIISEQIKLLGRASGISPLLAFENGEPEGMRLGTVCGTYLYGIFRSEKARVELLVPNKKNFSVFKESKLVEDPLDQFANHVSSCGLNYEMLQRMIFG
ncbi:cobyric acid synthase CobQ [Nitzschia inconspicua]|uniref:Cobyric acid synthase CobQ n=1 Tax=Nitzschia inconspicua TaxID=303405 RepID=A0A9K3LZL5_9STRA|nr:cobyric acid synthase CobQ [Nitzschia inconspicua]